MLGDDGQESPVSSYDIWNDEVFRYFFSTHKSNRDVRLTFDDAALSTVADRLNLAADDFINSVANLLNASAQNPFGKIGQLAEREREIPSTVALLAGQVLVASRMHSDSHYSAQAFWPRFNKILMRHNDLNPPRNCEVLDYFWRDLQQFLNVRLDGGLGLLRLPDDPNASPLKGWCHVNYPLSQCLVRQVDRRDLAEFFMENARARECNESNLLSIVAEAEYAFGKSFAATLRQAKSSPAFALELSRVLTEIRAQVSRASSSTSTSTGGIKRTVRSRLKITQMRGEYVLLLQQQLDDWQDVARLDAEQWEMGFTDDRGESLWSGADYTFFVEGHDGFVTSREPVRTGTRARLLLTADQQPIFNDDLVNASATNLPIGEALESLCCYQFSIDEDRDSELLRRIGVSSGTRPSVRLDGGLDIGRGRFVHGRAPRILVENLAGARVMVNKVVCDVDERGRVRKDRTPKGPGDYEVAVEDYVLRYSIIDLSEQQDSDDGGYVGYVLSRDPAVLASRDFSITDRDAAQGVKVLVGADLQ